MAIYMMLSLNIEAGFHNESYYYKAFSVTLSFNMLLGLQAVARESLVVV